MAAEKSDLAVISAAKDLCAYVMTVTQKSPKNFRYTFVTRMQNLCMDVIENLYRANDTYVTKDTAEEKRARLNFQHKALTNVKLLAYIAMLAMEQKCILPGQYEQISRKCSDCQRLTGAWINSDRKRLSP